MTWDRTINGTALYWQIYIEISMCYTHLKGFQEHADISSNLTVATTQLAKLTLNNHPASGFFGNPKLAISLKMILQFFLQAQLQSF